MGLEALPQVRFGNYKSYDDLGLILVNKDIPLPEPKLQVVDVPFMDGNYDFSEAIGNKLYYNNRTLKFTFYCLKSKRSASQIASALHILLHAKKMYVDVIDARNLDSTMLNTGANYDAFYGRVLLKKYTEDMTKTTIEIEVDADPYRGTGSSTVGVTANFTSIGQVVRWSKINYAIAGNGAMEVLNNIGGVRIEWTDINGTAKSIESTDATFKLEGVPDRLQPFVLTNISGKSTGSVRIQTKSWGL